MKKKRKKYALGDIRESAELYLLMLPVIALIFIFSYVPMPGILIGFQDYSFSVSYLSPNADWVGFKHFIDFFESPFFGRLFGNTIRLSIKSLLFTFWVPIAFALFLNEITNMKFKKTIQTISYLPYFISSVVVAGMVLSFLQTNGIINTLLYPFTGERIAYMSDGQYFDTIYILTNIWKSFGFSSILYMSSMSAIDPGLYEAAAIEGANRWHKIIYITLPSILPTIAVMFILAVGGLMNANTELILLLYSAPIYEVADVIGTYIYRDGLLTGNYSRSTAVGLFSTVINFCLVFIANKISAKLTDYSLW